MSSDFHDAIRAAIQAEDIRSETEAEGTRNNGHARSKRRGADDDGSSTRRSRREIELIDFADIKAKLDWAWLVAELLLPEQISIVWGLPGCRKTFMCLDIALHVAANLPWLGRRVEPGFVVYVAAEAGNTIRQRVAAWKIEHGYDGKELPFCIVPHAIDLCHDSAGDRDGLIEAVKKKLPADARLALIVIDTVNRSLGGGNENGPEDMGAFSNSLDRFRDDLHCHVLGVHHSGKNSALGPRGHSLLGGNVDMECEVTADDTTKTSTVTMHKQRDAEMPPPFSFGLKPVILGMNRASQIVTSCVVVPTEHAPKPKAKSQQAKKLSPVGKIGLEALRKAVDKAGAAPPGSNDIPQSARVVETELWRKCFYAMSPLDDDDDPKKAKDARKHAFQRARQDLQQANLASIWNDLVWISSKEPS